MSSKFVNDKKEYYIGNIHILLTRAFLSALVLQLRNSTSCTVVSGMLTDVNGLLIIFIWLPVTKQSVTYIQETSFHFPLQSYST